MGSPDVEVELARRAPCGFLRWPPLERVLAAILRAHGSPGALSVAVVDDDEMRELHRRYLSIDTPTDVLSFPLRDDVGSPAGSLIGEVVVSAETALREANRRGADPFRELGLYAIHGTLHLVGFDDRTPSDRREIRREERRWIAALASAGRAGKPPDLGSGPSAR